MGKMKPTTKNMERKYTHEVLDSWESSHEGKMVWKTWKHEIPSRMAYVFGFLLGQGIKTHFPKTDGFSNSNLGCHTLPIPCNNQLNQFLELINDWVPNTRKVVDSFDGFSLCHLDFPHWPKGLIISPSLFLVKSCPRLFNVAAHS